MNKKEFTAWKFALLDRMATDSRLAATDFRVAYQLLHYMDAATGDCFPAQETIGRDTGLTDRAVRRAIAKLEKRNWLQIEKRPLKGRRGNTNFHLFGDAMTGTQRPAKSGLTGQPDTDVRPNESGDPKKEEQLVVEEQLVGARAKKRTAPRTRLPDDFVPDLHYAMRKAGISEPEARSQAEQFTNFHLAKGDLMADWSAAWRTWCGNINRFGRPNGPARSPPRNVGEMAKREFEEHGKFLDDDNDSGLFRKH